VKIRIFIVFHKVFDECVLRHFSSTERKNWFVPYAVNEAHSKRVIDRTGMSHELDAGCRDFCLFEYNQVNYFPELQRSGFMETSCYVHVLANQLADDVDYIGVCQYDMRWTEEATALVRELSQVPSGRPYGFGISVGPMMASSGEMHPLAFTALRNWSFLLNHYNRFFSTNLAPSMLIQKPFTLYQTYLLPKHEFFALAAWLQQLCKDVFPWACSPPYETHWGSLGGYTERAASLFFAARVHTQQLIFSGLPLDHDETISETLGVDKEHYG